MLFNGCLVIGFKENNKFLLKVWNYFVGPAHPVSILFKIAAMVSIYDQLFEVSDHRISRNDDLNPDFNVWIFILFCRLMMDLIITGFAFKYVNKALIVFERETDEERRPLFETKENSEDT